MFGDCTMPVLLGYGMLVYIIASIFYMFLTCVTNVGLLNISFYSTAPYTAIHDK